MRTLQVYQTFSQYPSAHPMKTSLLVTLVLGAFPRFASSWTWPDAQMSELDAQRYDRKGYNSRILTVVVTPCDSFQFEKTGGRSNAADWIRTVSLAYIVLPVIDVSNVP